MSANPLDWNEWDDTALLQDWNQAFAEYEKYHSIYQSGKTLEEALTKEELELFDKELKGQCLKSTNDNAETDVRMDQEDEGISNDDEIKTESAVDIAKTSYVTEEEIPVNTDDQTTATTTNVPGAATLSAPGNLEGTPEGEALQNMIQAYYWAGYYKGFYEGLQQAKGTNER